MNKDVIYIDPEDDITDILAKLTDAKEKVVALVPPKKAGVLKSAVNIKLVAKTAKSAGKVSVLVTADPTLIKLAATARVPVAKTLNSRPEIPDADAVSAAAEQVIEEDLSDPENTPENPSKTSSRPANAKKSNNPQDKTQELSEDELEASAAKKANKNSKNSQKSDKKVPDIKKTRKWIILGVVGGIAVIAFAVWALAIAPSVKIIATVKTNSNNFSEDISFTTDKAKSDPESGRFVLEEQTYDQESKVEFTATGKKDIGNKATGTLSVESYLPSEGGSKSIPAGSKFTYNGMTYVATGGASLNFDGSAYGVCENSAENESAKLVDIGKRGCRRTTSVGIEASETGDRFNIAAGSSGWSSAVGGVNVYDASAISGGTTNIVTVVQQSDLDSASNKLASASEDDGYKALKEQLGDEAVIIKDSFATDASSPSSTPALGEEVKSGVTPILTARTTYRLYTVNRSDVEKYIETKASLADDQRIYSYGDPIFDRYSGVSNNSASAKLKTTYYVGPKVSEEEILTQSLGKKIGEVQTQFNSINGVSLSVEKSFFWVSSVPGDPNKVTVEVKKEDNNS